MFINRIITNDLLKLQMWPFLPETKETNLLFVLVEIKMTRNFRFCFPAIKLRVSWELSSYLFLPTTFFLVSFSYQVGHWSCYLNAVVSFTSKRVISFSFLLSQWFLAGFLTYRILLRKYWWFTVCRGVQYHVFQKLKVYWNGLALMEG